MVHTSSPANSVCTKYAGYTYIHIYRKTDGAYNCSCHQVCNKYDGYAFLCVIIILVNTNINDLAIKYAFPKNAFICAYYCLCILLLLL
jgi:hypothetical protein